MEKTTLKYKKLFESVSIGKLRIANRFVMPPMVTDYGDNSGFVTDRLVNYYQERAKYQVGLVIVEATCVAPGGRVQVNQLRIDDDKFLPGLSRLAEKIHQAGAKCFIQLHHGGRAANPKYNSGLQPVAPSPVARRDGTVPCELTIGEIERIIEAFVQGAKKAKEAGFDGIELHFAHNYLIQQFLSPLTNKRRDKYGGDLISRARIGVEITRQVRHAVGRDYPMSARICGDEFIKGGITLKETKIFATMVEEAGIDVLHVSGGYNPSSEEGYFNCLNISPSAPSSRVHGCFAYLAGEIKKVVKIPVIAVGRLDDPDVALDVVTSKKADLIAIGRGLIADPAYVSKVHDNRLNEIRKCIACRRCLQTLYVESNVRCTVNPELGKEAEYRIKTVSKVKKVLVIGGGAAGMEAARIAALSGHKVMLMEKNPQLGGNLISAAAVSFKHDICGFTEYLVRAIHQAGVDVQLNTEATLEKVLELKPDVVVLATGSVPVMPAIPGINSGNVTSAVQVLEGKVETGQRVIVAGGGEVGCEVAVYLAENGKKVTIVEMRDTDFSDTDGLALGMDAELRRWFYADLLPELAIDVIGKVTFLEVTKTGLLVLDREGANRLVEGDSVVFAAGMKAENSLKEKLTGKVSEIYEAGDCIKSRNIIDAMTEAAKVARSF